MSRKSWKEVFFATATETGTTTLQIKNLISLVKKNRRAARAARTLEQSCVFLCIVIYIYMKKFLHADWLRGCQSQTVQKLEIFWVQKDEISAESWH